MKVYIVIFQPEYDTGIIEAVLSNEDEADQLTQKLNEKYNVKYSSNVRYCHSVEWDVDQFDSKSVSEDVIEILEEIRKRGDENAKC